MYFTSYLYPIMSRLAAAVLLTAGGFKAQEVFTTAPSDPRPWGMVFLSLFELLLGIWLLGGLYPRWSRIGTLGVFIVFLHVALTHALEGQPSCGCLGTAPVRPWKAVLLDTAIISGLIICFPVRMSASATSHVVWIRWLFFSLAGIGMLLWLVLLQLNSKSLNMPVLSPSSKPFDSSQSDGLAEVIKGLERNYVALPVVVYTTDSITTEKAMVIPRDSPQGSKTTSQLIETRRHSSSTCIVRGKELRRDYIALDEKGGKDPSSQETFVDGKGRRVKYRPGLRQVWLTESDDSGLLETIDLRCAGFRPPVSNVAEWIRNHEVLSVEWRKDHKGREVLRVRAIWDDPKHRWKNEMAADCVPGLNYLPSRVVYWFSPGDSVWTVTDIEYAEAIPGRAWFPEKITTRHFIRDANKDPDAESGCNVRSETQVKVISIGESINDEEFDPVLPPNTIVTGNLSSKPSTGAEAIRASSLMRDEPVRTFSKKSQSPMSFAQWLPFSLDLTLVGICIVCRRRFAF